MHKKEQKRKRERVEKKKNYRKYECKENAENMITQANKASEKRFNSLIHTRTKVNGREKEKSD